MYTTKYSTGIKKAFPFFKNLVISSMILSYKISPVNFVLNFLYVFIMYSLALSNFSLSSISFESISIAFSTISNLDIISFILSLLFFKSFISIFSSLDILM